MLGFIMIAAMTAAQAEVRTEPFIPGGDFIEFTGRYDHHALSLWRTTTVGVDLTLTGGPDLGDKKPGVTLKPRNTSGRSLSFRAGSCEAYLVERREHLIVEISPGYTLHETLTGKELKVGDRFDFNENFEYYEWQLRPTRSPKKDGYRPRFEQLDNTIHARVDTYMSGKADVLSSSYINLELEIAPEAKELIAGETILHLRQSTWINYPVQDGDEWTTNVNITKWDHKKLILLPEGRFLAEIGDIHEDLYVEVEQILERNHRPKVKIEGEFDPMGGTRTYFSRMIIKVGLK